jgi:3-oxoacyl-[acyl-carrier protein] reductase
VAVVTGSSSGIGREIAVQLAAGGYDVVVHAARRVERAEETAQSVRAAGGSACVVTCDYLSVKDDFVGFVDRVFAWRGEVDCWVNNAGGDVLTGERRGWSFSEKLDFLWQVDVRATLLLSRLVAERMLEQVRSGCVINVGWDQATSGLPGPSGQMFACTKGAIMAMTAALAKSYAPQVRVNCVAPGWIRTEWGEAADSEWSELVAEQSLQRRWGLPADVAAAVAFLASPAATYINGQCLPINGGLDGTSAGLRRRLS